MAPDEANAPRKPAPLPWFGLVAMGAGIGVGSGVLRGGYFDSVVVRYLVAMGVAGGVALAVFFLLSLIVRRR